MAQDFTAQWDRARAAAQAAGDQWIATHTEPMYVVTGHVPGQPPKSYPLLDLCGRAYVETKLNTAFGRWCKATKRCHTKWLHFGINHEMRQEMGLHEAMAHAALMSLRNDGIPGLSLYTWID